jgi:hypothetical protein
MDKQKLQALKYLLSQVELLDDKGPEGEGWQSEEYLQGLLALRLVIEELEEQVNG